MYLKAPVCASWIIFPSLPHLPGLTTILKLVYIFSIYGLMFHNMCTYATCYIAFSFKKIYINGIYPAKRFFHSTLFSWLFSESSFIHIPTVRIAGLEEMWIFSVTDI